MREYGKVNFNPNSPVHVSACHECGNVWNREDLMPQLQWAGTKLVDTGFKVCRECYDDPNQQTRVLFLPPNPAPLFDALPIFGKDDFKSFLELYPMYGTDMFNLTSSMTATLKKN
jgi:hypothetical protein